MFYYFRFIRLLTKRKQLFYDHFSFNDFIHELTFLFKDASWYLSRSNKAFLEC